MLFIVRLLLLVLFVILFKAPQLVLLLLLRDVDDRLVGCFVEAALAPNMLFSLLAVAAACDTEEDVIVGCMF